jgi:hypothetical protein
MEKQSIKKGIFNPKESISRAKAARASSPKWRLESEGQEYIWASKLERVGIIRARVPYASIEVISKKINVSVKEVLHIFDLPQTTYNKKLREKSLLNGRDSEVVLLLIELVDFGIEVFNNEEEKFQRWMKKVNISFQKILLVKEKLLLTLIRFVDIQ